MATDLFLCRKNGRFFKYEAVEALSQTGAIETYSGVTGNASTNVVTIPGSTMSDGLQVTFTQLSGGSGVTVSRTYFARDSSGSTCKLAEYIGGSAVALGTAITAGNALIQTDEIRVWSAEYRDIFAGLGVQGGTEYAPSNVGAALGAPQGYGVYMDPSAAIETVPTGGSIGGQYALIGEPKATVSDEVGHAPLRQTMLPRTHWKFDMGASVAPRYLYAEWQTGDAVTPNPPNTI